MKVKATVSFLDLEKNVHREVGDTWTVSDERGNYLIGIDFVEKVEVKRKRKAPSKAD